MKKKIFIIGALAVGICAFGFQANAALAPSTVEVCAPAESDWDALLNSYEKYVDQYIKTMKKVQEGDSEAISSLTKLLEKAQDLQEKLQNVSDDMTEAQLARYNKITMKLAKAASQL